MKIRQLNDSYFEFFDITSEPSNQAAALARPTTIKSIEHTCYRSGTTSVKLLDDPYKFVIAGIAFKNWNPLLETFNEMVAKMEPNGLMEFWRRYNAYSTRKPEEIGPQVLTMDHLELGFLACCILLSLGMVTFFGEFVWSKCVTACSKALNGSDFEQNTGAISKIEVFNLNSNEPEKEAVEIEIFYQRHHYATSREFLKHSIEKERDGNALDMCNFDETTTRTQIESQGKFVNDIKYSIGACCVNNVAQGERDEIDVLIDKINFKPCVEINQIV